MCSFVEPLLNNALKNRSMKKHALKTFFDTLRLHLSLKRKGPGPSDLELLPLTSLTFFVLCARFDKLFDEKHMDMIQSA